MDYNDYQKLMDSATRLERCVVISDLAKHHVERIDSLLCAQAKLLAEEDTIHIHSTEF